MIVQRIRRSNVELATNWGTFVYFTILSILCQVHFGSLWKLGRYPKIARRKHWRLQIGALCFCQSDCDQRQHLYLYDFSYTNGERKRKRTFYNCLQPDMEFVQNFTPPDFQAKNFTPSISPNFNSFSGKKHKTWVKMEKFTPLAKILHCRRQWRHGQNPPLCVPQKVFWKGDGGRGGGQRAGSSGGAETEKGDTVAGEQEVVKSRLWEIVTNTAVSPSWHNHFNHTRTSFLLMETKMCL